VKKWVILDVPGSSSTMFPEFFKSHCWAVKVFIILVIMY